jgi:hypothetical protein
MMSDDPARRPESGLFETPPITSAALLPLLRSCRIVREPAYASSRVGKSTSVGLAEGSLKHFDDRDREGKVLPGAVWAVPITFSFESGLDGALLNRG